MKRFASCFLSVLSLLSSSVAWADGGAAHQARQEPPVKMGTSGGSAGDRNLLFCCAGTLGALVLRDGVLCILSNNHVVARSGSAAAGEDVLQPGLIDSGCSPAGNNVVGDFAGDLVPLGTANVDAALAFARANVDASGAILDVGVPRTTPQAATVGMSVMKSGRTTGFTTGTVTSINSTITVQYMRGCGIGAPFFLTYTNQIVTGAMSAGGDSGSLLLPTPEDLDQALQTKLRHEARLLRERGVIGVGIGAAEDDPNEAAIVIYFDRSRAANIPPVIDGFRTRVVLTDPIVAY